MIHHKKILIYEKQTVQLNLVNNIKGPQLNQWQQTLSGDSQLLQRDWVNKWQQARSRLIINSNWWESKHSLGWENKVRFFDWIILLLNCIIITTHSNYRSYLKNSDSRRGISSYTHLGKDTSYIYFISSCSTSSIGSIFFKISAPAF